MLLVASTAHADGPTPQAKEQARKLLDLGDERMKAKDPTRALEAYLAADAIMRVPTTGLAAAQGYLALGKLIEANDLLLRVARDPSAGAPKAFLDAQREASKLAASLAPRIPVLTLELDGPRPPELRLELDGHRLEPATLGLPSPVNPGEHRVVATAPGHLASEASVRVAEREARSLRLPALREAHGAAAVTGAVATSGPTKAAPATTPATPAASVPMSSAPTSTVTPASAPASTTAPAPVPPSPVPRASIPAWAWVGFALGGVGLAGGTVTGALALGRSRTLSEQCIDQLCSPTQQPDIDQLRVLSHTSTGLFALGVAGVSVGIVGLVLPRSESAPSTARVSVRPQLGPGFLGLEGAF